MSVFTNGCLLSPQSLGEVALPVLDHSPGSLRSPPLLSGRKMARTLQYPFLSALGGQKLVVALVRHLREDRHPQGLRAVLALQRPTREAVRTARGSEPQGEWGRLLPHPKKSPQH